MKPWIMKTINIGLMISFLLTISAVPFMKIHFFKEMHETFGSITIWLVFAHMWINRGVIKMMFKRKPTVAPTQPTPIDNAKLKIH